jgi:Zn-dependent protease
VTLAALFIELLTTDPALYLGMVAAVVVSIVLHELGHGLTATWQGDETPRLLGHLTLDPTKHMPPMSWLLLLVAGIAFGATPVNPTRFRSRYGEALVSFAGPFVNLLLALLALTVLGLQVGPEGVDRLGRGQMMLYLFGMLNFALLLFNLLPVPPLDGAAIVSNVSPGFRRLARDPANQPFFMGAFLLLLFFARFIFDAAERASDAWLGLFLRG